MEIFFLGGLPNTLCVLYFRICHGHKFQARVRVDHCTRCDNGNMPGFAIHILLSDFTVICMLRSSRGEMDRLFCTLYDVYSKAQPRKYLLK